MKKENPPTELSIIENAISTYRRMCLIECDENGGTFYEEPTMAEINGNNVIISNENGRLCYYEIKTGIARFP